MPCGQPFRYFSDNVPDLQADGATSAFALCDYGGFRRAGQPRSVPSRWRSSGGPEQCMGELQLRSLAKGPIFATSRWLGILRQAPGVWLNRCRVGRKRTSLITALQRVLTLADEQAVLYVTRVLQAGRSSISPATRPQRRVSPKCLLRPVPSARHVGKTIAYSGFLGHSAAWRYRPPRHLMRIGRGRSTGMPC